MSQTAITHMRVTRISSHSDKVYSGIVAEVVWKQLQAAFAELPLFDAIRFGVESEAAHIRYEVVGNNEALWLWAKDAEGEEELYQLLLTLASQEGWGLASGHTYIEVYHPQTGEPFGGDFFGNEHGISLSAFRVGADGIVRVERGFNPAPRRAVEKQFLDSQKIFDEFKGFVLKEYPFIDQDYSHETYFSRFSARLHDVRMLLLKAIEYQMFHLLDTVTEPGYRPGMGMGVDMNAHSASYETHEYVVDTANIFRVGMRHVTHIVELPEWVATIQQKGAFLNPVKAPAFDKPCWTLREFEDAVEMYNPARKK